MKSIVVIGLGLIGGSFAAAIKASNTCQRIVGFDVNPESIDKALKKGIIDEGCESIISAVEYCDVIMLSVPMLAMRSVLKELAQCDLTDKVITDVGSCKGLLVREARAIFGDVPANLVPAHPIAGSEKSGVGAAKADLFVAHNLILTPLPHTKPECLKTVRLLWEICGAHISVMGVEHHDEVLSKTSHLPHFLAFSLVDTLAGNADNQDVFRYAAGGFRDFTRIAGSDPIMWHDIALGNSRAILASLAHFSEGLERFREALLAEDSTTLLGIFERARAARLHFDSLLARRSYMASMKNSTEMFIASPGGVLSGELRVPGDKSLSHRSIMLGALAEGTTVVKGFLEGEDAMATLQAFRDMGVVIEGPNNGVVTIHGVGLNGLKAPPGPLYLGNAGTAMRLMAGLMAGQSFDVTMTGDDSLSGRPMSRVVNPLRDMGAQIETAEGGRPPLIIKGGQKLKGIDYRLPMASAQVQSCLLLAGMYAEGKTVAHAPGIVRDHTQRMLKGFEYPVEVCATSVSLQGGGLLKATDIDVPGDISSAAFFMVAASIAEGSELMLSHVGINPTRSGVIEILQLMGANISLSNEMSVGGEPVADILVRSAPLKGIHIPERLVPIAIDELPVLFIAASIAEGQTVLTGAKELRVKESDRIQSMVEGLRALGVDAKALPDGMIINGGGSIKGGTVDSHGDHRIAMAFAVASLKAEEDIRILDCANVATSFPDFVQLAHRVGFRIATEATVSV